MPPDLLDSELADRHITLGVYSVCLIAAAIVVFTLSWRIAVRKGLPRRAVLICLLLMAIAMPIGARLLHAATSQGLYADDLSRLFRMRFADFSLYGGFLLAALTGMVSAKLLKLNLWKLADAVAPGLGLGIVVTRVGCYFKGCCFGAETSLSWGVTFPAGSPVHLHQLAHHPITFFTGPRPVHPTQLYELLAALLAAGMALSMMRRKSPSGIPFLAAALWFTTARVFISIFRVPSSTLSSPLWLYPAMYAGLIFIGTGLLLWRVRSANRASAIFSNLGTTLESNRPKETML